MQLVSVENELEVYRQLISACDTLLKQYPTTALEDQATIQNATAFAVLSDRHQVRPPARNPLLCLAHRPAVECSHG